MGAVRSPVRQISFGRRTAAGLSIPPGAGLSDGDHGDRHGMADRGNRLSLQHVAEKAVGHPVGWLEPRLKVLEVHPAASLFVTETV